MASAALFALGIAATAQAHAGDPPVVGTIKGEVQGSTTGSVHAFKGIPYARPPVGPLRWRPPQPLDSWKGQQVATAFGPACPQPAYPTDDPPYSFPNQSEDCLTLNVWAPRRPGPHPVMVWLHGGGHRIGGASASFYDGHSLASKGVVVVTLNYRLGWLGFLAHPDLIEEARRRDEPFGNYGLMDQLAALEWVRHNAAAFGGDPNNVTIFGESAGARSILWLLTSPASAGKFDRAIVQSGRAYTPLPLVDESRLLLPAAATVGVSLSHELGASTAEDLRALPDDAFVSTYQEMSNKGFSPFVDGQVIVGDPVRLAASGQIQPVSLMIGVNSFEGSLVSGQEPLATARQVFGSSLSAGLRLYGFAESSLSQLQAATVWQDAVYLTSARAIAESSSLAGNETYLYYFDYLPEHRRDQLPGARHGDEIIFAFDNLDKTRRYDRMSAQDRAMADVVSAMWVSFASTGRPLSSAALPAARLRGWSAYRPEKENWYLISQPSGQVDEFRGRYLDFHEERMHELLSE